MNDADSTDGPAVGTRDRSEGTRRPDTGVVGIVLAGGRSKRFPGHDKALATLAGKPVIARVVETLSLVADGVIVSCRHEQVGDLSRALSAFDAEFVADAISDRGPVAGLRTSLRATDARYAVVCACDMPLVKPGVLSYLVSRARANSGAVASIDGDIEPLPAVVHVRAAESACTETLTRLGGELGDLLRTLDPVVVPERDVLAYADRDSFRNINTWGDLTAAADGL